MREIEFRAWLKNEKKMVDVEDIFFNVRKIRCEKREFYDSVICYSCENIRFDYIELM